MLSNGENNPIFQEDLNRGDREIIIDSLIDNQINEIKDSEKEIEELNPEEIDKKNIENLNVDEPIKQNSALELIGASLGIEKKENPEVKKKKS